MRDCRCEKPSCDEDADERPMQSVVDFLAANGDCVHFLLFALPLTCVEELCPSACE
jgi:hypothetical protein